MATGKSGSFTNSICNGNITLKVNWQEYYDIASNTSTISWAAYLVQASKWRLAINGRACSITINGSTYSFTSPSINGTGITTTLGSGTSSSISHNSDGSKSIGISCTFPIAATISGTYYASIVASQTVTLTTIPRTSSVSGSNGYIEQSTSFTISRASSSFTHTLTWACGSKSGTIATKTSSTTVYWTIPSTIYAVIPNGTSATVTVTCTTYSGSTAIGSKTCTITVYTKAALCGPTISGGTINDTNAATIAKTGSSSKLIRYLSTAKISGLVITGRGSSTIKSAVVKCGAATATISGGAATISGPTSGSFVVTVVDSRGYSATATYTAPMFEYIVPTIFASFYRPDQTGSEIACTFNGAWYDSAIGSNTPTLSVKYKWREAGGSYSSWISLTPVKSGATYSNGTSPISLGTNFEYRKGYEFLIRVEDIIYDGSTTALTIEKKYTVVRGVPVFDWGEKDFNFNVPVSMPAGGTMGNKAITGDILAFAIECPAGITPINTNEDTTNVPNNRYKYSPGFISKRMDDDQITITLYDYAINAFAMNTYIDGNWSGWSILADYPVEVGTTGVWRYRKWNSGTAECWLGSAQTYTVTPYNLMGGYYGNKKISLPAGLFYNTPIGVCNGRLGTGLGFGHLNLSAETCDVYILGNQNSTSMTVLGIDLKGRWK